MGQCEKLIVKIVNPVHAILNVTLIVHNDSTRTVFDFRVALCLLELTEISPPHSVSRTEKKLLGAKSDEQDERELVGSVLAKSCLMKTAE